MKLINYVLKISTTKTEVVYQPAPAKPYSEPTIKVNGQRLQAVDKFNYLGSTQLIDEVTARIAKEQNTEKYLRLMWYQA